MWSSRAAKKGADKHQGPFSKKKIKTSDLLKLISNMVLDGTMFTYDQLNNYITNTPELQEKIADINKHSVVVRLPGETPDTDEPTPTEPEEAPLVAPDDQEATVPDESTPPDQTVTPPALEPETQTSGPNSKQIVSQMAKRAASLRENKKNL